MARNKKTGTKIVIENLLKASVAISSCALLFACGGDSGSSGAPEKVELVSSVDDLGKCTEDIEGDTVFVKDEKTDYICIKGKWTNADSLDSQIHENGEEGLSSSVQDDGKGSCSSVDKISSSSSDRDDNESSSSVALSSSSAKSESYSSSSFKYEQDSSAFVQPDVVAVKDKSISGVSQKGPFVTGSTIKLYELDGKTYTSTGKSFPGKIASDDGKFNVSSINLASQYALLEATGYFRNEIAGRSSGPITLNALTDISDRKTVNINLLTHLEYERVLYLVGLGINVAAAKRQAEAEILNAFAISGDFASSEDLNIFSEGDGNAVLLAVSILMLGKSGAAELTERMAKFATDIEKDGSWDDEEAKAKIADWAQEEDVYGGLKYIRENIEGWKLGTVPDFEKYVRNFWYTIYGIGRCDKTREGEVIATRNERSNTFGKQDRYICKDEIWGYASEFEKDFYKANKESGEDGELWTGPITGNVYKYDEVQKQWLWTAGKDITLNLKGCTTKRMGEVGRSSTDGKYYICRDGDWEEATDFEKDTYKWTPGEDGEIKTGNVTDTKYDYDGKQKKWRVATTVEATLGGCTETREIDISLNIGKLEKECYICKSRTWESTECTSVDKLGWGKGNDGELRKGDYSDVVYKYDEAKKEWILAVWSDTALKLNGCTTNRLGEVVKSSTDNTYYICRESWWDKATDLEKDTYQWAAGEDGEIKTGDVTNTKYDYDGEQKKWRAATIVEAALGGCTESRETDASRNIGKLDGVCYICKSRIWESTECFAVDKRDWNDGNDGELRKGGFSDYIYKYDEAKKEWILAEQGDTTLKLNGCTTNRAGEFVKSPADNTYYICNEGTCRGYYEQYTYDYSCWVWQKPQGTEYDTYGETCSTVDVGKRISGMITATNKYYCTLKGWVKLQGGRYWYRDLPKEAFLNPEITYGTMTDSRDNKVYKTIKIGNQVWMAENLNYADSSTTPSLKGNNWCYDIEENCEVIGRFYAWTAAIEACPNDWHLPSSTEWNLLFNKVGGSSTAGKKLKSQSIWGDDVTDDVFGFSAIPAGFRMYDSIYYGYPVLQGDGAYFWSSTEYSGDEVYFVNLGVSMDDAYLGYEINDSKKQGFSIRCVQD